jgi:hypothetical protein
MHSMRSMCGGFVAIVKMAFVPTMLKLGEAEDMVPWQHGGTDVAADKIFVKRVYKRLALLKAKSFPQQT